MSNEDEVVERANAMKTFPNKSVTLSDFGIDNIDWAGGNFLPHDLIDLHYYKLDLMWESVIHKVITGETIPAQVWSVDRLVGELKLENEKELTLLLFAGSQLAQYQSIEDMEEQDRNDYIANFYDTLEDDGEEIIITEEEMEVMDMLDRLEDSVANRKKEIDMLNDMWGGQ